MAITGHVRGVTDTMRVFGGVPSLLRQAGMAAMTASLALLSHTVRERYLVGPYPTEIERRSGSFRATFQRGNPLNIWEVTAQGTQVLGTFGSDDTRGRILNDGGTIRSTRPGGFLAIRTEFTKTPRGVVREKYRRPLRTLPNTFVAKRTVFERIGRRIVPIAWLRREVFIRGRQFLQKTERTATPGIQTIFQQRFEAVLGRLQETLRGIRGR